MVENKESIKNIETITNEMTAKLEILRTLENQKLNIETEINKTKEKLKNEMITKFTYATIQELNQKNLVENTNDRKKIWNEIAESINTITELLNKLKEDYNKKVEIEGLGEIKEKPKQ